MTATSSLATTTVSSSDLIPSTNRRALRFISRKQQRCMTRRIAKANRKATSTTANTTDSKTVQRCGQRFRIFSSTSTNSRISRLRTVRRRHYRAYTIPSKAALLNGEQDDFQGGALDTGAQRSVVGMKQAKAYCDQVGIDFNPVRSQTLFRFGKGRSRSLGKIPFVISTPQNMLTIWVDVVPQNIPLLIGLDVLDKYSLQVLSVYNELECVREKWRVPVQRKHGLIYWDWSDTAETFFTRPQLERLHRHLLHPSTRKLYNLLRRARPEELSSDTTKTLDDIKRTCETCQLYAPKQLVFRIRDSDTIRFNQELLLDVMYLDASKSKKGKPEAGPTHCRCWNQIPKCRIPSGSQHNHDLEHVYQDLGFTLRRVSREHAD